MKIGNDISKEKWWVRGPRTSRHLYFYPTNAVPGIMLFSLIAVLGCIAIAVAVHNMIQEKAIHRHDIILGGVGLFCCVLAVFQIRRLLKDD